MRLDTSNGFINAIVSAAEWVESVLQAINAAHERQIVTFMLFSLAIAFTVKMVVFFVLTRQMLSQQSRSPLGRALLWHYASLSIQAFFLVFLYLYYARLTVWGTHYSFTARIILYGVVIITVYWVAITGAKLVHTYYQTQDEMDGKTALLDSQQIILDERGKSQISRGKRQDRRARRQDKREVKQDARSDMLDGRE